MTTPPTLDPTATRDAIERRLLAELDCACGHGVLDHSDGVCAAVLDESDQHPVKPCPCDQWRQQ